jgi:hypothetical protein
MGQRHVHDYIASRYNNLTEFLLDPRNDFHVWYKEHHARPPVPAHELYGPVGLYDWWYTVDGEIPPNVELVKLEEMRARLPRLIEPYANGPIPDLPHENTAGKPGDWWDYYTPEALSIVDRKFRPCFDAGHYPRFPINQLSMIRRPNLGYVVPALW